MHISPALEQKDEQAREELEQATAQLNRDMMRVENERQQLASSYADEKERLEKGQQDSEVAARRESELQAAEHQRRMSDIDDRLRRAQEAEAREKMELVASLQRLRQQAEETPPSFFQRFRGFLGSKIAPSRRSSATLDSD